MNHRVIFHIDFNSYFASVEQQANPHLRGKPIGVTGGDRMIRTVIGAASVEAKKMGVKTGMSIPEALKICPQIILVKGDSDKYLSVTKKFLNIVKSFSPLVEVFSIDEVFIQIDRINQIKSESQYISESENSDIPKHQYTDTPISSDLIRIAQDIKKRIKWELGEYITCSVGISYNKLMAKLAGSLQKPDGLVVIANEEEAIKVLDSVELDEICGIGYAIKKRLNNMGVFNFKDLRNVPLKALLASFKSYGQVLYNVARGIDERPVLPFFEKEEVKSIGHRHTIDHDTSDPEEIKQLLLKLTELIARKLRSKKLVGKTINFWYRLALHLRGGKLNFDSDGMQITISYTQDGVEIFNAAWKIFHRLLGGQKIRMVGVSISNLKPENPVTLSLLTENIKQKTIIKAIDKVNNRYGEFTLQRGILLGSTKIRRKLNPFLADYRFKV